VSPSSGDPYRNGHNFGFLGECQYCGAKQRSGKASKPCPSETEPQTSVVEAFLDSWLRPLVNGQTAKIRRLALKTLIGGPRDIDQLMLACRNEGIEATDSDRAMLAASLGVLRRRTWAIASAPKPKRNGNKDLKCIYSVAPGKEELIRSALGRLNPWAK
jgi:hypothetical protein